MVEKITNKEVLERFDIKFVSNYITRIRLSLTGGIIKMKEDKVPARLITAFIILKDLWEDLIIQSGIRSSRILKK